VRSGIDRETKYKKAATKRARSLTTSLFDLQTQASAILTSQATHVNVEKVGGRFSVTKPEAHTPGQS
jgi:hypothetical protein